MFAQATTIIFLVQLLCLHTVLSQYYGNSFRPTPCRETPGKVGLCQPVRLCSFPEPNMLGRCDRLGTYVCCPRGYIYGLSQKSVSHPGISATSPKLITSNGPTSQRTTTTTTLRPTVSSVPDVSQSKPEERLECNTAPFAFIASNKISNGNDVHIKAHPWVALLRFRNGFQRTNHICGGTLISKRYVLTAAHCVHERQLRDKGYTFVHIRLGDHNKDTDNDCQNGVCNEPVQEFTADTVVVHPEYNYVSDTHGIPNDIALVRLNKDAIFTEFVQPACLPYPDRQKGDDKMLTIMGWGNSGNGRVTTSTLQEAIVPIVDRSTCLRRWKDALRRAGRKLGNGDICIGGNTRDACQGESGGPLFELGGDSRIYVVGVASFGYEKCGAEGWPGLFTNVEEYLPWILKTIKP